MDQLRDEIICMLTEFAKSGMKILLMSQGQYLERVQENFKEIRSIKFASKPDMGQEKGWRQYIEEWLQKEHNVDDLRPFIDNLIKDPDRTYHSSLTKLT